MLLPLVHIPMKLEAKLQPKKMGHAVLQKFFNLLSDNNSISSAIHLYMIWVYIRVGTYLFCVPE